MTTRGKSFVIDEHVNALKQLNKNNNIVITKPDKGAGVYIMNNVDAVSKMNAILSVKRRFMIDGIQKHLKTRVEQEVSRYLVRLEQSNLIGETAFKQLKTLGCRIPEMYGLLKLHSAGAPLRPILST